MTSSNPSPQDLMQQAKTLADLVGESLDAKVKKDLERQLEINERNAFVYLLSTSWFEKWRAVSGFDTVRDGISVEPSSLDTNEPLPVINDDIVDHTMTRSITKPGYLRGGQEYLDVVLKRGIVEGEFFIYITHDIWSKLKMWYPDAIMVKRRAYYNAQRELSYEIHCHLVCVFHSGNYLFLFQQVHSP
jgi:hypothetical protein